MSSANQFSLFEDLDEFASWKEHWENMPEFIQEDMDSFQSIIVHFETKEDRDEFSKLLQQKITYKTKSLWFPKYNREKPSNFLYVSNSK
jgi:transcription elongation factor GreA-like protein